MDQYKSIHPFDKREEECKRVITKHPNRVPILVFKDNKKGSNIPDIDKHKFLVPADLTFGQFNYVIRKRIKLKPEIAIFTFINGYLPPTSALVANIYNIHKDKDGFLYVIYTSENTFG